MEGKEGLDQGQMEYFRWREKELNDLLIDPEVLTF